VPDWQNIGGSLCYAQDVINFLQPHSAVVAGLLYLLIVSGLIVVYLVLSPHYIHYALIPMGFRRKATNHVWFLALTLLLFNGVFHAVDVINSRIPFEFTLATKLGLAGNAIIVAGAIIVYIFDCFSNGLVLTRGIRRYFAPVIAVLTAEDLFYMYWVRYHLTDVVKGALATGHRCDGSVLVLTVCALAVLGCLAALCWRQPRLRLLTTVVFGLPSLALLSAVILAALLVGDAKTGRTASATLTGPDPGTAIRGSEDNPIAAENPLSPR